MGRKRSTSSSHLYYHHWSVIKVLVIVGAIVTILLAILYMLHMFPIDTLPEAQDWFGMGDRISIILWTVAWGIGHIIIAVGLLSGAGAVRTKKVHILCDWWVLIILGLVIVLPTGNWGGVIVLIAGVIGLVDRLD